LLPTAASKAEPGWVFLTATRKPKGYAHQLVERLGTTWDLSKHPALEPLAELSHVGLAEKAQKGGVGGPAFQIQTQGQIEGRAVPTGKAFEIPGAAAAAENSKDRHQQQEPLGVADAASHASIWDGAENTDQVGRLIT
jgi:hypothetical protein